MHTHVSILNHSNQEIDFVIDIEYLNVLAYQKLASVFRFQLTTSKIFFIFDRNKYKQVLIISNVCP